MESQIELELQPIGKQQSEEEEEEEEQQPQQHHQDDVNMELKRTTTTSPGEPSSKSLKARTTLTLTLPSSSSNNNSMNSIHDTIWESTTPHSPTTPATPTTISPHRISIDPSTSRQLFREAAAVHGGAETTAFLQHESVAQQKPLRSASSTLDATVSRNPSTAGKHEKKIGHRRVVEGGEVTYKKIQSKQIMGSIQLGIQHTVGSLASKPKRDLLMNDFWEMETISFPPDGSSITPAHHYSDFRFKVYAPIAFRYFRDLFGIAPDDFLMSMCASPLRELSNPGASGSIFYLTDDDEFIIKTVQKKECEFLQKLLPGYYMNLSQNPRTLLPKFFGLYCFHYNSKNVRLVAMNNLLPSDIKMHAKYDLKGSSFRRKASKAERQKASPTFKDLDFQEHHPNGIFLETDKHSALMKTIQRDCMVLESFQIMDYSLLVGIHNLDIAAKEKREERIRNARAKLNTAPVNNHQQMHDADNAENISINYHQQQHHQQQQQQQQMPTVASTNSITGGGPSTSTGGAIGLNRTRSMNRQRLVAHSTAMESITADMDITVEEDDDVPAGGIPARSENDERLILYIGIIDILQSYRLEKKLEHTFKSILYNGDTVSVCRPSFYAKRFQEAMAKQVFKKTPTFPLKHSPSKRKTSMQSQTQSRTPSQRMTTTQPVGAATTTTTILRNPATITMLSGMSTPPPAFDDISEEDITANSTTTTLSNHHQQQQEQQQQQQYHHQHQQHRTTNSKTFARIINLNGDQSYSSSIRSSGMTSDYSDDDDDVVGDDHQQQQQISTPTTPSTTASATTPKLTKTRVQVTTVGCVEDNRQLQLVVDKKEQFKDNDDNIDHHQQQLQQIEANGKSTPLIATTKTTFISAKSYTSTLVLNDEQR